MTWAILLAIMNHDKPRVKMPKYGSIEGHNCSVVENWVATYSDPIQVANGETIELDGRVDVWDGHTWLWAKNLEGKEGWIPDCIVSNEAPFKATESYSAMELTCRKGQSLKALRVLHGWAWCSDENGKNGWVPERNLHMINRS